MKDDRFGGLPLLKELDAVESFHFSPDGKRFAASFGMGNVCIYDTLTWG
jgi:hypothetical protein